MGVQWSYMSLTDICMFSFDISFEKKNSELLSFELILFIHVCVLKFKLVDKPI